MTFLYEAIGKLIISRKCHVKNSNKTLEKNKV